MKKFVKSKLVLQIVMISLAATLATAGIIGATTIGADISTTGELGAATTTIGAGDLIVDTDTLVVDESLSRVGIGTSTPAYLLDVDGDFNVGIVAKPSTFYVDTNNERVGIGSTTPTATLSVGTASTVATASTTIDFGKPCFRMMTETGTVLYYYPSLTAGNAAVSGWATSTTSCF